MNKLSYFIGRNFLQLLPNTRQMDSSCFLLSAKRKAFFFNKIDLKACHIRPSKSLGGLICTFSLLIPLSLTFQSSKSSYSSSPKCCLTRTDKSFASVQLSFHYLKRDRTRRCFLFSVTCHIRIFLTDCEMIPELIICY